MSDDLTFREKTWRDRLAEWRGVIALAVTALTLGQAGVIRLHHYFVEREVAAVIERIEQHDADLFAKHEEDPNAHQAFRRLYPTPEAHSAEHAVLLEIRDEQKRWREKVEANQIEVRTKLEAFGKALARIQVLVRDQGPRVRFESEGAPMPMAGGVQRMAGTQ